MACRSSLSDGTVARKRTFTERWRASGTHLHWDRMLSCTYLRLLGVRSAAEYKKGGVRIASHAALLSQKLIFRMVPFTPTSHPAFGVANPTAQKPVTPFSGYHVVPSSGVHAAPPAFAVITTVRAN